MMRVVDGQTTLVLVRAAVALLAVAVAAALVARRIGLPDAVAFVAVGLVAPLVVPSLPFAVTPELVLAVLLPGLVFEAAYRLHYDDLRRSFGAITFLAIPGVLVSAAIVAVVLSLATGLRADLAFVVGAMVSATDPAAVVSTFAKLRAPRRLIAIVDAESLLNDGTGLVVFAISLQVVTAGVRAEEAVGTFVAAIILSTAVGAAFGAAAAAAIVRLEDHVLQVALSVVAAYGAYLVAAAIGLSGVIATVIAGIVLGNYGRHIGLAPRTEVAMDEVWEFIAFALGGSIFLLVGVAIGPAGVVAALGPVVWGTLAVFGARAVVVYGLIGGAVRALRGRRRAPDLPLAWLHLLFWAGLRGAVATAAALSLPSAFPERELLLRITFGIVIATLVIQGTTAGWLLRRALPRDA